MLSLLGLGIMFACFVWWMRSGKPQQTSPFISVNLSNLPSLAGETRAVASTVEPVAHPHVEGMRKWVTMRQHLADVGMPPEAVEEIGQKIVQRFAAEAMPDEA